MPVVALVLFAVFAALGFGWRSWEQRRRTGSTGFRGISGRPGSIEWSAGVGFIVSMAAAVFAPILQLVGWCPRCPARLHVDPHRRSRDRDRRHRRDGLRPVGHG